MFLKSASVNNDSTDTRGGTVTDEENSTNNSSETIDQTDSSNSGDGRGTGICSGDRGSAGDTETDNSVNTNRGTSSNRGSVSCSGSSDDSVTGRGAADTQDTEDNTEDTEDNIEGGRGETEEDTDSESTSPTLGSSIRTITTSPSNQTMVGGSVSRSISRGVKKTGQGISTTRSTKLKISRGTSSGNVNIQTRGRQASTGGYP